ncbi:cell division protein SepF [Candidatus Woesearchaeota archaeon]|nr:MAG: cell division protein SepF [Candidatus Woesearchaeota archaeon]
MMKRLFSLKRIRKTRYDDDDMVESQDEYVELNTEPGAERGGQKVLVRSFTLEDFSDIKDVLDVLREGYTICLINIKPLKEKDLVELKRAINKLKKTCEAIDGDIAGLSDDYIVVTPSFAEIFRPEGEESL